MCKCIYVCLLNAYNVIHIYISIIYVYMYLDVHIDIQMLIIEKCGSPEITF